MWSKKSNPDLEINTLDWKDISLEYGKSLLKIKVPPYCDTLKMGSVPALKNPREKIENALSNPIESQPLEDIISSRKNPSQTTVAIAVSDNTRPVPYHGEREDGVLLPLLKRLEKIGVKAQNIKIIVTSHCPCDGLTSNSSLQRNWSKQEARNLTLTLRRVFVSCNNL